MKRNLLFLSIFSLLLTAVLPSHAVLLRYALKKGAVTHYQLQLACASRSSGMGQETSSDTTTMEQKVRFTVTDVAADGTMTLEGELLSGKITLASGDQEKSKDFPKDVKISCKVTPLGKVSDVKDAATPKADETASTETSEADEDFDYPIPSGSDFDAPQFDFITDCTIMPLPEKDVKPGDTWEDTMQMKNPLDFFPTATELAPITLTIKSELLELLVHKGRKCARIRTLYEVSMGNESPAEMPVKVTVSGKLAGNTEWFFDYEHSCTPTAQGTLQMLTKAISEFPPEIEKDMPEELRQDGIMAMKANMKTSLIEK